MRQSIIFKSIIILGIGIAVVGGVIVLGLWANAPNFTIIQPSSSPSSTIGQSYKGESRQTINQVQQKFIQQQTTVESLFQNYNSCLPRLIAPRELEANNYPYEDLIEMAVCTHDTIKKFAKELDFINDEDNFIDLLRFGTCDQCSESYYLPRGSILKQ